MGGDCEGLGGAGLGVTHPSIYREDKRDGRRWEGRGALNPWVFPMPPPPKAAKAGETETESE